MARHRSPQSRHASLGLLSPRFAVTGAGGAGGFRTGGYVRHARSSTSPLGTPTGRIAAAVLAVAGIAGTAHLSTHGTLLPDADEVSGWFATGTADALPADAAVPAPRAAPGAAPIADAATIAALGSTPAVTPAPGAAPGRSVAASTLTGAGARDVMDRAASAAQQARETARSVRAEQAAAASAAAASAAASAPAASTGEAPDTAAPAAGGSVRIVSGRVSSGFGSRWGTAHQGLDIAAPIGTPIHVPMAGTVISSGPASGFGLWVRVRHADGTVTVYGHINRSLVTVGEKVGAGQQIAEVGNRGQSTGPHLHIEVVTPGGTKINPKPWLDEHGFRYGA